MHISIWTNPFEVYVVLYVQGVRTWTVFFHNVPVTTLEGILRCNDGFYMTKGSQFWYLCLLLILKVTKNSIFKKSPNHRLFASRSEYFTRGRNIKDANVSHIQFVSVNLSKTIRKNYTLKISCSPKSYWSNKSICNVVLKFVFYKLFANSATRWVFLCSKIISNIAKSYQIFDFPLF